MTKTISANRRRTHGARNQPPVGLRILKGLLAAIGVTVAGVAVFALLMLCTAYLVDGSFNPFLYFRF